MTGDGVANDRVADVLERVGALLDRQDENPFRAESYRRAADAVRGADEPVARTLERGGIASLRELPDVGERLAGAIREIVETGRLGLLESLESRESPERVLARVPGIGEELARRIHDVLDIDSLEELEVAAHDGRLADVEGIGDRKLAGIRDALAGMLSRPARRRAMRRAESADVDSVGEEPSVTTLLAVDDEYRRRAEAGELRTIAPRRFNPDNESWLPVLEAERDGWSMTALFSNTAKAHELDKTHDWVVLYWERGGTEGQSTVVTAERGSLEGKRVVRGRESECRDYYGD
jgi:hypothetical protein